MARRKKAKRPMPRKAPNLLGSVPRTYDPPGPAPKEHLSYMSPAEMQALKMMTDGIINRGPRGIPSFAVSGGALNSGGVGGGGLSANGSPSSGGGASTGTPGGVSGGALNSGGVGGGGLSANGGNGPSMGAGAAPPGGPPSGLGGLADVARAAREIAARDAAYGAAMRDAVRGTTFSGVQPGLSSPSLASTRTVDLTKFDPAIPGALQQSVNGTSPYSPASAMPRSPSQTPPANAGYSPPGFSFGVGPSLGAIADVDLQAQKAALAATKSATPPTESQTGPVVMVGPEGIKFNTGRLPQDTAANYGMLDVPVDNMMAQVSAAAPSYPAAIKGFLDRGMITPDMAKDLLGQRLAALSNNRTEIGMESYTPGAPESVINPSRGTVVPSGPPALPALAGPNMGLGPTPAAPGNYAVGIGANAAGLNTTYNAGMAGLNTTYSGGMMPNFGGAVDPPYSPGPDETGTTIDVAAVTDTVEKLNRLGLNNYNRVQRAIGNRDPNGRWGGQFAGGGRGDRTPLPLAPPPPQQLPAAPSAAEMNYLFTALQAAGATPDELAAVMAIMNTSGA